MTATPYNTTYDPPAPTCDIVLESAEGERVTLSALLDTGADATMVPMSHLRTIGARRVFETGLRSQWGERRVVFLYLVDVYVAGTKLPGMYVVGDERGDEVVLGRDVLNRLRMTLDGPALLTRWLE